MTEQEFKRRAAGIFNDEQVEFLLNNVAMKPHSHTADEIVDFDESVSEILDDTEEDVTEITEIA